MKTTTALALALGAILVTVFVSAALQTRHETVFDSHVLSWAGPGSWW